jgi:hypothetical protein
MLLDDEAPRQSHGVNVDEHGNGLLQESRLYQLIRKWCPVKAAGVTLTIGVARGKSTREQLGRAGADAVVADLQELLHAV